MASRVSLQLAIDARVGRSVSRAFRSMGRSVRESERSHRRAAWAAQDQERQVSRLGRSYEKVRAAVGRLRRAERDRGGAGRTLSPGQAIGQGMAVAGTLATMTIPVKLAIDREEAMAGVGKVLDMDVGSEAFKAMDRKIGLLSRRIPMVATQIHEIVEAAGQAGIARGELLRFAEDAAKMGVAFDMSGKEAGEAMTGLRTIFQLSQDDVVSLGDSYNHLSNNMNATARDILNIANRSGSTGKLFGLSGEEVGALGAAFLELKTPPEIASRAINSMLMKLRNAENGTADFQKALDDLGWSAEEMVEEIGRNGPDALVKFLKAVGETENPLGILTKMFGEGFADEIAKLVDGVDGLEEAFGRVADKSEYAGSMLDEYNNRSSTTRNKLTLMMNTIRDVGAILGDQFLPWVQKGADWVGRLTAGLGDLIKDHPGVVKALGAIGAGFAGLVGLNILRKVGGFAIGGLFGRKKGGRKGGLMGSLAGIKGGVQPVHVVNMPDSGLGGVGRDGRRGRRRTKGRRARGRVGKAGKGKMGLARRALQRVPGVRKLGKAGKAARVGATPAKGSWLSRLVRRLPGGAKMGKKVAKVLGKSVLKKIPIVGALFGGGFAIHRLLKGDVMGAAGELLSGLASTVPVLGTAASLAIDAGLAARDMARDQATEEPEDGSDLAGAVRAAEAGTASQAPAPGTGGQGIQVVINQNNHFGSEAQKADVMDVLVQGRDRLRAEVERIIEDMQWREERAYVG